MNTTIWIVALCTGAVGVLFCWLLMRTPLIATVVAALHPLQAEAAAAQERIRGLDAERETASGEIAELRAPPPCDRNYQALYGLQSRDSVLMFIPIEPAFMLAVTRLSKNTGPRYREARPRRVMRQGLLIIFLLSLVDAKRCESANPHHADVTAIDATPAFWKFWDATSEDPDGERVQAFFSTVVAAHPDLFNGGVLGSGSLTNRSDDQAAQQRVATYLHDVAPFIPRMRYLSNKIRDFPRYAQEFGVTFPDYAPTTPVYFTVSLFAFDAGARITDSETAVFFSLDGIARFDGTDANFKVIIDHELFHQYHHQIAPELSDSSALWAYLWEEGLATFVSQQMNLGSTESQVLMIPPNLSELASPMLPALARELLNNLDSTNRDEFAAYFALENHRPDLPIRSGYYVGYRIAKKLASGRSLQNLAALRGPKLKAAMKRVLTEFARER